MRLQDTEVEQHLKLFTFLNEREIELLMQKHKVRQPNKVNAAAKIQMKI